MKKRGKINSFLSRKVSNRLSYTIIAVVVLMLVSAGVYALTAGTAPNPGHTLDNVAPPSSCYDNAFLKWTGTGFGCEFPSFIDIPPPNPCDEDKFLKLIDNKWVCENPSINDFQQISQCSQNQILKWTGTQFVCSDTVISNKEMPTINIIDYLILNGVNISFTEPPIEVYDIAIEAQGWMCEASDRNLVCNKICISNRGYTGGEYVTSTNGGKCGIFYCDCWVLKQTKI
jgi:hypothetical protein